MSLMMDFQLIDFDGLQRPVSVDGPNNEYPND
jgi:hypothetical protein